MLDLAMTMAFVEEDEGASTSDDVGTVDVSTEPSVNAMATNTQEESMADITDETASTGNLGTVDDSMDLTNNSIETDTPGVDKHASIVDGKVLSNVVRDSPEGPLKQPRESCLKPAKNKTKHFSLKHAP
jgi:hypothetical protein